MPGLVASATCLQGNADAVNAFLLLPPSRTSISPTVVQVITPKSPTVAA